MALFITLLSFFQPLGPSVTLPCKSPVQPTLCAFYDLSPAFRMPLLELGFI